MCLFKTKILMNTRLKCKISKVHEDHGVTSGWLCLFDWVSIKCISSFSMYHQITPNKWHDVLFGLMSSQILLSPWYSWRIYSHHDIAEEFTHLSLNSNHWHIHSVLQLYHGDSKFFSYIMVRVNSSAISWWQ
jgi:hypothetical protein